MQEEVQVKKDFTDQELAGIAVELVSSLKPKGLKIWQIHRVIEHMQNVTTHITYGPQ